MNDWLNERIDAPGETGRDPQPRWAVMLEDAFVELASTDEGRRLYGDVHRGASLEQAWRTRTLFGSPPVCLIAKDRFTGPTAAIPDVVPLAPEAMVRSLAGVAVALAGTGLEAVQLFCLGNGVGHSIVLRGHDPRDGSFIYHDPWPRETLLGRMGISPHPAPDGLWSVKGDELEQVIQAAFVEQPAWSFVQGQDHRIRFADLTTSEFWAFFHLVEVERSAIELPPPEAVRRSGEQPTAVALTRVHARPEAVREAIGLEFIVDAAGYVEFARLAMEAAWVSGEQGANPLAFDLAASFIRALTPSPDSLFAASVSETYQAGAALAIDTLRAAPPELQALVGALLGEGSSGWPGPAQYSRLTVHSRPDGPNGARLVDVQSCSPTFGFQFGLS